ncbi:MAG: hypothetical protein EA001_11855 [Oscillatoriales cyanobacterium]|nr:MAG: hypothetical protein EA001_11855 [Oscillatoriales cyanobacterium]
MSENALIRLIKRLLIAERRLGPNEDVRKAKVDALDASLIDGNKELKPLAATTIGAWFGPKTTFQTASKGEGLNYGVVKPEMGLKFFPDRDRRNSTALM